MVRPGENEGPAGNSDHPFIRPATGRGRQFGGIRRNVRTDDGKIAPFAPFKPPNIGTTPAGIRARTVGVRVGTKPATKCNCRAHGRKHHRRAEKVQAQNTSYSRFYIPVVPLSCRMWQSVFRIEKYWLKPFAIIAKRRK
jgi:hypothetical protein